MWLPPLQFSGCPSVISRACTVVLESIPFNFTRRRGHQSGRMLSLPTFSPPVVDISSLPICPSHSCKDHKLWKHSNFGLNPDFAIDRLFDPELVTSLSRPQFPISKIEMLILILCNSCKGQLKSNVWTEHKLGFNKWKLVCHGHPGYGRAPAWALRPIPQAPPGPVPQQFLLLVHWLSPSARGRVPSSQTLHLLRVLSFSSPPDFCFWKKFHYGYKNNLKKKDYKVIPCTHHLTTIIHIFLFCPPPPPCGSTVKQTQLSYCFTCKYLWMCP